MRRPAALADSLPAAGLCPWILNKPAAAAASGTAALLRGGAGSSGGHRSRTRTAPSLASTRPARRRWWSGAPLGGTQLRRRRRAPRAAAADALGRGGIALGGDLFRRPGRPCRNLYYGNDTVAKYTVDHILSYMRSSPTWAYNGGARSWGDAGNNAKWLTSFGTGFSERGQMHYRSGPARRAGMHTARRRNRPASSIRRVHALGNCRPDHAGRRAGGGWRANPVHDSWNLCTHVLPLKRSWVCVLDHHGAARGRSGLNMIPLIEWYRTHPDELFLLEIAIGAISGQLANIDENGATSMMSAHTVPAPDPTYGDRSGCAPCGRWHAMPYVMDFDPHSGDFGLGFFGHCLESGAYYVVNETMGELCYLCDVAPIERDDQTDAAGAGVKITPRDSFHSRVFLGACGGIEALPAVKPTTSILTRRRPVRWRQATPVKPHAAPPPWLRRAARAVPVRRNWHHQPRRLQPCCEDDHRGVRVDGRGKRDRGFRESHNPAPTSSSSIATIAALPPSDFIMPVKSRLPVSSRNRA